jgi:hypothetical protein
MFLVQLLLPIVDRHHRNSPYELIAFELSQKFGGLTAYTRSPAQGRWKNDANVEEFDDVVVYEVMSSELDRSWWSAYRKVLEVILMQNSVVIRIYVIELID